jgi:hypothetical protein
MTPEQEEAQEAMRLAMVRARETIDAMKLEIAEREKYAAFKRAEEGSS